LAISIDSNIIYQIIVYKLITAPRGKSLGIIYVIVRNQRPFRVTRMSELKTKRNDASVIAFLDSVENTTRREDSYRVLDVIKKITKKEPEMWGQNMVGFGSYEYKYESGREGSWFVTGFSPRKQNLVVYIMPGFSDISEMLEKLGKHKIGKSCLYINKLSDIDIKILEKIIKKSIIQMEKMYKCN